MTERDMTLQEILEDLAWSESNDDEQQAFEAWLNSPEGVDYVNFKAYEATTQNSNVQGYGYA
ncbi:MAG: hypothetical protein IPL59_18295 [Candidatus Competibacteraceae bacterium]|nr:hypothetical protein [Candidatus Competibacteraceae bacterium]